MCLVNIYYPLVKIGDKQKVLFHYPYEVHNRDDYEFIKNVRKEFYLGKYNISNSQYINYLCKKEKFDSLEKLIQIPCGSCSQCLNDISRAWAFRILKEAEKYDDNYFITLTYNDENLPYNQFLIKDTISKFNKKLKTYLNRNNKPSDFRFYGVGEYGSKTKRPHYHILYFNLKIDDLEFIKVDEKGFAHFDSKFIRDLWGLGNIDIGTVDVGSACYVARYCDKKKRLSKSERIKIIEKGIVPEFSVMSRRPGIGSYFLEEATNNFKVGKTSYLLNHNYFNLPLYYSKKIKDLLKDSPNDLKAYEEKANLSRNSFIGELCQLGDACDLFVALADKDKVLTHRKL